MNVEEELQKLIEEKLRFEKTAMAKTGKRISYWRRLHKIYESLTLHQRLILDKRLQGKAFSDIATDIEETATDVIMAYEMALSKFRSGEV